MINENLVLVGGRVLGCIENDGWSELWLRVPYVKGDNTFGVNKIPIDLVGNKGVDLGRDLKKGDYAILKCMMTFIQKDNSDGNNRRLIRAHWDEYARPTIVRGNGSVPDLDDSNAHEGVNIVRLGGIAGLSFEDKESNKEHPTIKELGDGKKMCHFDIGYKHRASDKPTYFNLSVFGGLAEKKVGPYLRAGDSIMVRAQLGMRKTKEKFSVPNPKHQQDSSEPENIWVQISTPTLWVNSFNGADFVTPKKRSNDNSNKDSGGPRRDYA